MAQFISKEPIEFKIMPDTTLPCLCGNVARWIVTVRKDETTVKLPVCRWHAMQAMYDPDSVFRM